MRKWRRGKCKIEEYLKERKEYKRCREKKKEYIEKERNKKRRK